MTNGKIYLINKSWNRLSHYPWSENTANDVINDILYLEKAFNERFSFALIASCGSYGDFLISPIPKDIDELNEKLTNLFEV